MFFFFFLTSTQNASAVVHSRLPISCVWCARRATNPHSLPTPHQHPSSASTKLLHSTACTRTHTHTHTHTMAAPGDGKVSSELQHFLAQEQAKAQVRLCESHVNIIVPRHPGSVRES